MVDLSADFRLDQASYERWYQPHEAPELLGEAVYGLPEAHREEIAAASLVAGPGCNSTAALLATLPLRGRIDDAVFDIKAGVSGAGREATEETHYSSAAENVNAYKVEGHRHSAEIEQELGPGRFSFVTHLVPLDQGILATCYLTVPGLTKDEAVDALPRGLRRRAVRGRGGRAAAHPARAGHQPLPGARDGGGRPDDRVRRDRQPLEGRGRPGAPGPEPDARAARDGGPRVTGFFRSRWVERPAHVRELDPTGLPQGFRAAGVAAGLKPEGLDVGVLVSDAEDTVSAARFTTNARVGAPVVVSRQARTGALRAVAANAAHSNVGDGRRGLETALAQQAATAEALGVEPEQVAVASTGVIGTQLPREPALAGIRAACAALDADAGTFSEAILTSDRGPKRACLEVQLPSGTVTLSAQAKGAGHDLPALRHHLLLRADRRAAGARDVSSCSPACASSARSTASAWTASSPRATPWWCRPAGPRAWWSSRRPRTRSRSARRWTRCCASWRSRS